MNKSLRLVYTKLTRLSIRLCVLTSAMFFVAYIILDIAKRSPQVSSALVNFLFVVFIFCILCAPCILGFAVYLFRLSNRIYDGSIETKWCTKTIATCVDECRFWDILHVFKKSKINVRAICDVRVLPIAFGRFIVLEIKEV